MSQFTASTRVRAWRTEAMPHDGKRTEVMPHDWRRRP